MNVEKPKNTFHSHFCPSRLHKTTVGNSAEKRRRRHHRSPAHATNTPTHIRNKSHIRASRTKYCLNKIFLVSQFVPRRHRRRSRPSGWGPNRQSGPARDRGSATSAASSLEKTTTSRRTSPKTSRRSPPEPRRPTGTFM